MASFLCQVQTIQRGLGRSAVAAAAYRSGTALCDERLAMDFDFSGKAGVEFCEVIAPAGAPEAFLDREALWNAAEKRESRKDAVPAREVLVALPHELNFEQRRDLVRDFVATHITARGMIADVAMHLPGQEGDQRNFHAHILVTTRELSPDGFGQKNPDWWSPKMVREWRAGWAKIQNEHLRLHLGPKAPQVTHLRLAERGEEGAPSIHLGPAATALERKGTRTQAGDHNRDALAHNEVSRRLRRDFAQTADRLAATAPVIDVPLDDLILEVKKVRGGLIKERDGFERQRLALAPIRPPSRGQIEREFLEPDLRLKASAKAGLVRVEARVERVRRSRLELVAWIRSPARMIFAKHAELNALDKARRVVKRADLSLADRRAWLQSPAGRAMIAARRQPALDQMSAASTKRRTLERKIKRLDKRIEAAGQTVKDLRMAQALGVPSLKVPAHAPDATRFIRGVSGPSRTAIARFPLQLREQALERLRSGQVPGILRSLTPGR